MPTLKNFVYKSDTNLYKLSYDQLRYPCLRCLCLLSNINITSMSNILRKYLYERKIEISNVVGRIQPFSS